jgi:hypothetical protein
MSDTLLKEEASETPADKQVGSDVLLAQKIGDLEFKEVEMNREYFNEDSLWEQVGQHPLVRCCNTCRWHDVDGLYKMYRKNAEGMGNLGFCRRNPPLPGQWRIGDDPDAGRIDYFMFADWPETCENDFCGEWEKRDSSPNAKDMP